MMAARAMWKGVIRLDDVAVPVKLYAAVEEQRARFRLLSRKDRVPVRQVMVRADTGMEVPRERIRRAYVTESGHRVILTAAELEKLEPRPSRDIEVFSFVPASAINPRWYQRPYYLGPDTSHEKYFALADALEQSGREGVTRWVCRWGPSSPTVRSQGWTAR